jgi:hypothetical protein
MQAVRDKIGMVFQEELSLIRSQSLKTLPIVNASGSVAELSTVEKLAQTKHIH